MSANLIYKGGAVGKVEDVDKATRTVKGYFSIFGNVDAHKDRIMPGAFKKTVAENGPMGKNRIKFLRDHDPAKPVGPIKELYEDSRGLVFVAQLNDTRHGKDLAILYDSGEITEHSVGFVSVREEKNDEGGYDFFEVKQWEGSAVLWAANERAKVIELKARFDKLKTITELSEPLLERIEEFCILLDRQAGAAAQKQEAALAEERERLAVAQALLDFRKTLKL